MAGGTALANLRVTIDGKSAEAGMRSLAQGSDKLARSLLGVNAAARTLGGMSLAKVFAGLSVGYLTYELYGMSKQILEIGNQFQGLKVAMESAVGNKSRAAQEMKFVREEANRLGVNVIKSVDAFTKLAASTRETALEGEMTRRAFTAIAQASRALSLSSEQQYGAFVAIYQIASKSKVSMEELRQQLGDRIPGAMNIAARAMNMTTNDFYDFVAAGKLASTDFLPKFIAELEKLYTAGAQAASKLPTAELERLVNTLYELANTIFEAGVGDAFSALFRNINEIFTGSAQSFQNAGKIMASALQAIADGFKWLSSNWDTISTILTGLSIFFGAKWLKATVFEGLIGGINRRLYEFKQRAAEVQAAAAQIRKEYYALSDRADELAKNFTDVNKQLGAGVLDINRWNRTRVAVLENVGALQQVLDGTKSYKDVMSQLTAEQRKYLAHNQSVITQQEKQIKSAQNSVNASQTKIKALRSEVEQYNELKKTVAEYQKIQSAGFNIQNYEQLFNKQQRVFNIPGLPVEQVKLLNEAKKSIQLMIPEFRKWDTEVNQRLPEYIRLKKEIVNLNEEEAESARKSIGEYNKAVAGRAEAQRIIREQGRVAGGVVQEIGIAAERARLEAVAQLGDKLKQESDLQDKIKQKTDIINNAIKERNAFLKAGIDTQSEQVRNLDRLIAAETKRASVLEQQRIVVASQIKDSNMQLLVASNNLSKAEKAVGAVKAGIVGLFGAIATFGNVFAVIVTAIAGFFFFKDDLIELLGLVSDLDKATENYRETTDNLILSGEDLQKNIDAGKNSILNFKSEYEKLTQTVQGTSKEIDAIEKTIADLRKKAISVSNDKVVAWFAAFFGGEEDWRNYQELNNNIETLSNNIETLRARKAALIEIRDKSKGKLKELADAEIEYNKIVEEQIIIQKRRAEQATSEATLKRMLDEALEAQREYQRQLLSGSRESADAAKKEAESKWQAYRDASTKIISAIHEISKEEQEAAKQRLADKETYKQMAAAAEAFGVNAKEAAKASGQDQKQIINDLQQRLGIEKELLKNYEEQAKASNGIDTEERSRITTWQTMIAQADAFVKYLESGTDEAKKTKALEEGRTAENNRLSALTKSILGTMREQQQTIKDIVDKQKELTGELRSQQSFNNSIRQAQIDFLQGKTSELEYEREILRIKREQQMFGIIRDQTGALSAAGITADAVKLTKALNESLKEAGNAGQYTVEKIAAVLPYLQMVADKTGLALGVVAKLAQQESSFNIRAIGQAPAGAMGLFQVIPSNFPKGTLKEEMLDPLVNANAAAQVLIAGMKQLGITSQATAKDIGDLYGYYFAGPDFKRKINQADAWGTKVSTYMSWAEQGVATSQKYNASLQQTTDALTTQEGGLVRVSNAQQDVAANTDELTNAIARYRTVMQEEPMIANQDALREYLSLLQEQDKQLLANRMNEDQLRELNVANLNQQLALENKLIQLDAERTRLKDEPVRDMARIESLQQEIDATNKLKELEGKRFDMINAISKGDLSRAVEIKQEINEIERSFNLQKQVSNELERQRELQGELTDVHRQVIQLQQEMNLNERQATEEARKRALALAKTAEEQKAVNEQYDALDQALAARARQDLEKQINVILKEREALVEKARKQSELSLEDLKQQKDDAYSFVRPKRVEELNEDYQQFLDKNKELLASYPELRGRVDEFQQTLSGLNAEHTQYAETVQRNLDLIKEHNSATEKTKNLLAPLESQYINLASDLEIVNIELAKGPDRLRELAQAGRSFPSVKAAIATMADFENYYKLHEKEFKLNKEAQQEYDKLLVKMRSLSQEYEKQSSSLNLMVDAGKQNNKINQEATQFIDRLGSEYKKLQAYAQFTPDQLRGFQVLGESLPKPQNVEQVVMQFKNMMANLGATNEQIEKYLPLVREAAGRNEDLAKKTIGVVNANEALKEAMQEVNKAMETQQLRYAKLIGDTDAIYKAQIDALRASDKYKALLEKGGKDVAEQYIAGMESVFKYERFVDTLEVLGDAWDDVWDSMIDETKSFTEFLSDFLKQWLYKLAGEFLKQKIVLSIAADIIGPFYEQNQSSGTGSGTQQIVDATNKTTAAVKSMEKTTAGVGGGLFSLLSGLFQGTWQFLASIITLLTTGSFAQAGEKMAQAGSTLSNAFGQGGMISKLFSSSAWSFGTKSGFGYGADKAFNASMLARAGYAPSGGAGTQIGAGWYGVAGIAGYYGANALYKGKGYSGMGGSLGAMGGMKLGAMVGSAVPGIGTIVGAVAGAILGAVAGGALGGMFGGEKIKGGVGYYDFNRRMAGAAHKDTDPAIVEMMQNLGTTLEGLDKALRSIKGFEDMWNFGASFQLDTDSAGRVDAAYNSYARGLQKASFKATEDAAKWFVEQMVQDIQKQFELHAADMGGLGAAITNIFSGFDAAQLEQELGNLSQALPEIIKTFAGLSQPLQAEVSNIARWHAKSIDDIVAIMSMAKDVQEGYADSLWGIYTATKSIQDSGETLTAAYQRAIGQFDALRDAFMMIHGAIIPLNNGTILWSDSLAEAAGGLDQLTALQSAYFEAFYTEAERTAAAQKLASVEVKKFNDSIGLTGDAYIDTRAELRKYVEGLDLGSEAGMKAYVAVLKLAGAIATLDPAAEDAAASLTEFFNSLSAYTQEQLKPGDNTAEQAAAFFENFYSEAEKAAARMSEWNKQVADFNTTLGLSGDAYIDTKDELRAYIESLDLTTEEGKKAYEAAMKLVAALLGLEEASTAASETLSGIFGQIFNISNIRTTIKEYVDAIEKAKELGATAEEVWSLVEQGLRDLTAMAQDFVQSASQWSADEFAIRVKQALIQAFEAGGLDVAYIFALDLEQALQDAINAAIWKTIELRQAWEEFNLSIADRIGRLYGGEGADPGAIWSAGARMFNAYAAAWESMNLEQRMAAVNTMLNYIDQWVAASIAQINKALTAQIDAINSAADAQIEAINATTEAMQKHRDEVAESYSDQIDALQEILDAVEDWVNVVQSIDSMLKDMRTGTQNPLPLAVQLSGLSAEIARKQAEFQASPTAALAEEIRALLQQRLELAQQVFQRPSPEYLAIYQETMRLLEELLAAAPEDARRAEDIQKEIERLTKEQNKILKDLDEAIEDQQKIAEAQIDAINASREAQIKAAEEAAEAQRNAVYDTAKQMYETMQAVGNQIYEEMMKQAQDEVSLAQQQLNALREMIALIRQSMGLDVLAPPLPVYERGINYVPNTGPAILHQGEKVIPAGGSEDRIAIRLGDIHIHGEVTDPNKIKVIITKQVDEMIPYIKRKLRRS